VYPVCEKERRAISQFIVYEAGSQAGAKCRPGGSKSVIGDSAILSDWDDTVATEVQLKIRQSHGIRYRHHIQTSRSFSLRLDLYTMWLQTHLNIVMLRPY
jgi:flavin-dependent dehydrogenase